MCLSRNHLQVWKTKLTFKYIATVLLISVQNLLVNVNLNTRNILETEKTIF